MTNTMFYQAANQNDDVWASHWRLYQTLERISNFFIRPHHVKLGNEAMHAMALAERVMECRGQQQSWCFDEEV